MVHRVRKGCVPAAAIVSTLLFCACGGATRAYRGEARPPGEVVALKADASVRILEIDGRKMSGGFASDYEVLPGVHEVSFKILFRGEDLDERFKGMRRYCVGDAKFVAEPGATYEFVKVSDRTGPGSSGIRWKSYDHDFGVVLLEQGESEPVPEAISPLSCGG